jgi:hypothetical protein
VKRATQAEVAARVEEVLYCRLNGAEFHDLQAHAREKGWTVSDRQLWRYVEAADQLLGERFETDRERLFRRHVCQRRALYARALQDGDYRTALVILRDEAQLHGLYAASKVQMTGAEGGPLAVKLEPMPDDERHAAIAAILARYGLAALGTAGAGADRDGPGEASGPILGGPRPADA